MTIQATFGRTWAATIVAGILGAGLGPSAAAQNPSSGISNANRDAVALEDFQHRLHGYLKLRDDLVKAMRPLSPTADSAQLAARQEAIAAAVQVARKDAQQGDLIPSAVASRIRATIARDFASRKPAEKRAAFEEVSEDVPLRINRTYPAKAALPTVPPLLLQNLPPLPDSLQYRFVARHLVLLDGDAHIVVDYVINVLPSH